MPANNKSPGLDQAFRKLFGGDDWIKQTQVKDSTGKLHNANFEGVLQNDISFGFSNNFQGNLLSTIDQVTQSIGGNVAGGAVTALWGMAKAGSTLAGYTLGTTGVASTKTYNGSSISSFTLDVKWLRGYSNKADLPNVPDFNLMSLLRMAYPVGIPDFNVEPPPLDDLKAIKDMEFGWDGGDYTDAVGIMVHASTYSLIQSVARPPVPVDIKIKNSSGKVIYQFTNFVISNLTLFGSRETYGGYSLVTGANISFEIYQTPAVGSLSAESTIIFNGVDLLATKAKPPRGE